MAADLVLRTEFEGVLQLTLNRPEKLNALNAEMFAALRAGVDDLRRRKDLRVLLITAKGRYFSSGVDLTDGSTTAAGQIDGAAHARSWMRVDMLGMHALYEEMERVEKPIVVAHQAPCLGGGLELSLSCDFRLAARNAAYGFPEMKFGMLPLSGGVNRLTHLCGAQWAKWLAMAGQTVSAERALLMGLVQEVYPDETFEAETRAFCVALAKQPAEAMAAAKLVLGMIPEMGNEQGRQLERLTFSTLTNTRDRAELSQQHRARLNRNAQPEDEGTS